MASSLHSAVESFQIYPGVCENRAWLWMFPDAPPLCTSCLHCIFVNEIIKLCAQLQRCHQLCDFHRTAVSGSFLRKVVPMAPWDCSAPLLTWEGKRGGQGLGPAAPASEPCWCLSLLSTLFSWLVSDAVALSAPAMFVPLQLGLRHCSQFSGKSNTRLCPLPPEHTTA